MSSGHEKSQEALDKLCAKIRKKSKTKTNVSLEGFWSEHPPNHAAQLGPALLNSTVVSEFTINLEGVQSADHVNPFLPFLRTNQHLRKLAMKYNSYTSINVVGEINETLVGMVLDAASENEGIEEINLEVSEPFESVLKCIQRTKPRVLSLTKSFAASHLDRIGDTLKVNPNLHSLTLHKADNVHVLLQHLVPSPQAAHPPLEILTIGFSLWNRDDINGSTVATELAPFVAATSTLRRLKLYSISAPTTIEPLVKALEVNQSINDLVVSGNLGHVATQELSTFLQSSDANTNGIRHLELRGRPLGGGNEQEYLASFLGPCLQSMNLGCIFTSLPFLRHLLKTDTIDRLPRHLHVRYLRYRFLRCLAVILPRIVRLQDLTLSFYRRQGGRCNPMLALLPALRQHWSLTSLSLVLENGEPYYKKETDETKKMQAYCTRNAVVPALLTGDSLQGDPTDATMDEPVRHRIVPSVYVLTARHESPMARNSIFKGVFAIQAEVESDGRPAKRRRLE